MKALSLQPLLGKALGSCHASVKVNSCSLNCGMWFRRIEDLDEVEGAPVENPEAKQDISVSTTNLQQPLLTSSDSNRSGRNKKSGKRKISCSQDDVSSFKRVRLLHRSPYSVPIPPSRPMSPTPSAPHPATKQRPRQPLKQRPHQARFSTLMLAAMHQPPRKMVKMNINPAKMREIFSHWRSRPESLGFEVD
jgi:hypothetical protein